jgi:hypothetical protein
MGTDFGGTEATESQKHRGKKILTQRRKKSRERNEKARPVHDVLFGDFEIKIKITIKINASTADGNGWT